MRSLGETAQKTFLYSPATDSAGATLDRISAADDLTHLIVRRTGADTQALFHLWNVDEAYVRLCRDESRSLEDALELIDDPPLTVWDVEQPLAGTPLPCLVAASGVVVGFVDGHSPPKVVRGSEPRLREAQVCLETECPDRVHLGRSGLLQVSLWVEHDDLGLPSVPIGETLNLKIVTSENLRLQDRSEYDLRVVEPAEPPITVPFEGIADGLGRFRLLLSYRGVVIGQTVVRVMVGATDSSHSELKEPEDADIQVPRGDRGWVLPASVPDLTLWILERFEGGRAQIDFELTAPNPSLGLNRRWVGSKAWGSKQEIIESVDELFDAAPGERSDPRRWQLKGLNLFERLFPPDLQKEIWRLREHIHYVQIQSEEPWLPWELCRLSGRNPDGRIEEAGFLCEDFAVTRWRPGLPQKPWVQLRNMAVVMPASDLEVESLELPKLQALEPSECRVHRLELPNLTNVERVLMSSRFDALHFCGHGEARGRSSEPTLRLAGGDLLTPSHISGRAANFGARNPMVFLNACHTAGYAPSLGSVDGWASRFLEVGCSAFVGTYWPVRDATAARFATTYYERLMAGKAVADAVREARLQARQEGCDGWLAYTAYAYPLANRRDGSEDR